MVSTTNQEVDERLLDSELFGNSLASGVVAKPGMKCAEESLALKSGDLIAKGGVGGRSSTPAVASKSPVVVGAILKIGENDVVCCCCLPISYGGSKSQTCGR